MYLFASSARAMMKSHPDYYEQLQEIKPFANGSFCQIDLDIPRLMNFMRNKRRSEVTDAQIRALVRKTLKSYAKRNHLMTYLQSQGPLCNTLAQIVYFGCRNEENIDEVMFWLYNAVLEHVYPIAFNNHIIEP